MRRGRPHHGGRVPTGVIASTLPQNSDGASLPSAGTRPTALATEPGAPWAGFALAANAVVRHLLARFGWDLWLVHHGRADHTVVVASAGPWQTSARPGEKFQWPWSGPAPTAGMAVPLWTCRSHPGAADRGAGEGDGQSTGRSPSSTWRSW